VSQQPYRIEPQRHVRKQGWCKCEPHQAQMWATLKGARVIARCTTKWQAELALAADCMSKSKRPRTYRMGQRVSFPRGNVLYSSLTREQYERTL
jgi:hypothetical protein